jgi:hypothetical protein
LDASRVGDEGRRHDEPLPLGAGQREAEKDLHVAKSHEDGTHTRARAHTHTHTHTHTHGRCTSEAMAKVAMKRLLLLPAKKLLVGSLPSFSKRRYMKPKM